MIFRTVLACVSLCCLATPAFADGVALTPLLTDATVRPEDRAGVHQVLSSELDFAPEVSRVVELTRVPEGLDDWCLTNPRCLTGIANSLEVDGIVAGRISMAEANLVLDLVYFHDGAVVRRQAFVVPRDPTGLANAMSPVTRELLTGVNPRSVAATQATEEDFEVHDELDIVEEPLGDFDFGSADPAEISVASLDEPPPAPVRAGGVEEREPVAASRDSAGSRPDPRPTGRAPSSPPRRTSAAAAAAQRVTSAPRSRSVARVEREPRELSRSILEITARGGYSNYYTFDFVTAGAEAALRLGGGVQLVAGMEMYAVQRLLPREVQAREGVCCQWDAIYPFNAGLLYEFGSGELRPYIGADAIVVQYYRDEVGRDIAGGARARVGLDYMVSNHFGLNVNVAAGAWTGQNWPYIERGLGQTGFLPQVSAGTVFAF